LITVSYRPGGSELTWAFVTSVTKEKMHESINNFIGDRLRFQPVSYK
jgi:hypothetical protein